jgi:hypothetical protein
VTSANINLEANYEYVVCPSVKLFAYLKALTTNNSPFILLHGPEIKVLHVERPEEWCGV